VTTQREFGCPEAPRLDDGIGDRHLAVVRDLLGAPLTVVVADVETRQIDHHLVDLLGQSAFLDHDVHLGAERRPAAVGCKSIAIANDV